VNTSPPTTGKTNRLAATTDRLFRISERGSSIRTELLAGISMFLASAYTIVVIPGMLADAGVPRGAATTAVIIVAVLGTFAMGLFANLPLVLAPGLGGVALVAYTLVQGEAVPFGIAMGIVFWSGILFLLLTVFGIRSLVTRIMPTNVRLAIGSGIGLYIAFIGFRSTGLVVGDGDSLVLGDLGAPAALLALAGIVLLVALQARKVPGAFVIVIVAITLVGIPLGVTELPSSYLAPPDSPGPVAFDIDLIGALAPHYFPYLFAFFAAEFFSTTGVVLAVTEKIGDATGRRDADLKRPFLVDSAAIAGGSLMGAPSVTTYLESAAGTEAGGRTGLTSWTTAVLYAVVLAFIPVAGMIPSAATAPVLVVIGLSMLAGFRKVDTSDITEAIPAALLVSCTLLWGNFGTGIATGLLSYVLIKAVTGKFKDIHPGMWVLTPFLVYFFVAAAH
jgi:adenine/guanine/hypoxanthine permease